MEGVWEEAYDPFARYASPECSVGSAKLPLKKLLPNTAREGFRLCEEGKLTPTQKTIQVSLYRLIDRLPHELVHAHLFTPKKIEEELLFLFLAFLRSVFTRDKK